MMMQSLTGFKKLKSLEVEIYNYFEEEEPEELEILSLGDKIILAQETIKIMKRVLPIEVKASVVEILDYDYLDDMDNDIDSPNKLVLIKKEANEDPKLIMLQQAVLQNILDFGLEFIQVEPASLTDQAVQADFGLEFIQVEPESLTVQAVQEVVFAVIIFIYLIYSISSMY